LYKEEGLNLRYPAKRKQISAPRASGAEKTMCLNEYWAKDFVSDQLCNGQRFRALTIIDTFSRECLDIYANKSIKGETVKEVLDSLKGIGELPKRIKADNGPEFFSRALDARAYTNHVKLEYSRPGKPTDNSHIEPFNGSFRDECLNVNWFMSLEDAKRKIDTWKKRLQRVQAPQCTNTSDTCRICPEYRACKHLRPKFLTLKVDLFSGDTQSCPD